MIDLHIILSTLTMIVMIIAGIQAIFLAWQDYLLRHSQWSIKKLPALEVTERRLFRTLIVGLMLLTFILLTSIIFFRPFTLPLLYKTLLTLITWSVFSVLLTGRFCFGWRGRIAVKWTLAGVILLILIYSGTGFLLHDTY